ncbi:hypothetical protein H105_00615 [Trichophyton soudanense CBS 452.61]|uniref:Uncharacterized protein n=2 Tax=Trichophyton TaxID=5550 RepID=A0A178F8T1_TRIVO|nr:hypothetical protein H105_00615 [Trichophyton soudanense CBS 452.61]EZG10710.1 hypothetical protein H106_00511 [Trichophyton rubrum CBS 735.88]OAL68880.1 hypothetical protein A7D00_7135 [Trichophyton violaceum]
MKFISVIALLAPVVLAAPQAITEQGWIGFLKEKCPDISKQCLDIADKAHQPTFDKAEAEQAAKTLPTCNPAYETCIQTLTDDAAQPGTTRGDPVTCLLQIAPDHIKYFLDNDKADIPIPSNQNCALRELHRVAHVELGPLA